MNCAKKKEEKTHRGYSEKKLSHNFAIMNNKSSMGKFQLLQKKNQKSLFSSEILVERS